MAKRNWYYEEYGVIQQNQTDWYKKYFRKALFTKMLFLIVHTVLFDKR